MVPVIQRHGGSIDKFLGDGIMATFGAAQPSPTYAADALGALEGAMRAAADWHAECEEQGRSCPRVNGAVATGQILFGAVGDESRLEYTVIGDAVNLAAKLEKHNKELGTRALCDRATYDRAVEQGYAPAVETIQTAALIAGVSEPMDLVVVAP
jgi:adenylate cyclase